MVGLRLSGQLFYAPNRDDQASWTEVGTMKDVGLAADEVAAASKIKSIEPYTFVLPSGYHASWAVSMADVSKEMFDLAFGMMAATQHFAAVIEVATTHPMPQHPVKGYPYVGKRYRQACREWQRKVKAWKRSTPHRKRLYFPDLTVESYSERDAQLTARLYPNYGQE